MRKQRGRSSRHKPACQCIPCLCRRGETHPDACPCVVSRIHPGDCSCDICVNSRKLDARVPNGPFELVEEWSAARTPAFFLIDWDAGRVTRIRKTGPGRWLRMDPTRGIAVASVDEVTKALLLTLPQLTGTARFAFVASVPVLATAPKSQASETTMLQQKGASH